MVKLFLLRDVIYDFTGIRPQDLLNGRKFRELVEAREIFARVCRDDLFFSYPRIGRELHMDHSSVINLVKKHRVDPLLYQEVRAAFAAAVEQHRKETNNPKIG